VRELGIKINTPLVIFSAHPALSIFVIPLSITISASIVVTIFKMADVQQDVYSELA
jgi:hypothetical protein